MFAFYPWKITVNKSINMCALWVNISKLLIVANHQFFSKHIELGCCFGNNRPRYFPGIEDNNILTDSHKTLEFPYIFTRTYPCASATNCG